MESNHSSAPIIATIIYSRILRILTIIGFVALLISYGLYVFQIIPAYSSPTKDASLLSKDTQTFIQLTHRHVKWEYIKDISYSDIICQTTLSGIGLIVSICMSIAIVLYLRKRSYTLAILATLQTIILLLAASGIL